MLSILGERLAATCDGSRRQFLKLGGLALGGMTLPQILQAEETSPATRGKKLSHKAIIMIYLSGGPSHQDMYDLKMDAPKEFWPQASCALLAGGGMRMGQVIGSTNRLGEVPQDRPIHYQDVFATLYRQLGIDVNTATITDPNGRPQYLLDRREPVRELV